MNAVGCAAVWAGRWAYWAVSRACDKVSRVGVRPVEGEDNEVEPWYDPAPPEQSTLVEVIFRRRRL